MPLPENYLGAIRGFEGFTPKAAWDYKQWTNGYGTKAQHPGEQVDEATAQQRYNAELTKAAGYVDSAFPDLPAGRRAALTSLTYNAGPGWINAGLGDSIRSGDWNGAAQRFLSYNKAGGEYNEGLARRRAQEVAWFDGNEAPIGMAFKEAEGKSKPMAQDIPEPALGVSALAQGPGALFGASGGPSWQDLGGALQNAGAWAMANDYPQALGMIKDRKTAEWQHVQGQDGTIYAFHPRTGQIKPLARGEQKLDPSVIGKAQEGYEKSTILHATSEQGRNILSQLDKGELDLSLASKGKAVVENAFGSSSPQTQKYNNFQQFRTEAANAILQAAKGTQTEGDAQRAYDQFVNGLAANDNASVRNAIEKLVAVNGKLISSHKTGYDAYRAQYPNARGLDAFGQGYDKMTPFYAQQPAQAAPAAQPAQRPPLSSFRR